MRTFSVNTVEAGRLLKKASRGETVAVGIAYGAIPLSICLQQHSGSSMMLSFTYASGMGSLREECLDNGLVIRFDPRVNQRIVSISGIGVRLLENVDLLIKCLQECGDKENNPDYRINFILLCKLIKAYWSDIFVPAQ